MKKIILLLLFSFILISSVSASDFSLSNISFVQGISITGNTLISAFDFNAGGTKIFVTNTTAIEGGNFITEYTLLTPFDLSTAVFVTKHNVTKFMFDNAGGIVEFKFANDGTYLFLAQTSPNHLHRITLTSPYDLSTAVTPTNNGSLGTHTCPTITIDENHFYCGEGNTALTQFNFGTPFTPSTLSFIVQMTFGLSSPNFDRGLNIAESGNYIDVFSTGSVSFRRFCLSPKFSLASGSLCATKTLNDVTTTLSLGSMYLNEDNGRIFLSYNGAPDFYQLTFFPNVTEGGQEPFGEGSFGSLINETVENFNQIFPDSENLSLKVQLTYVFLIMFFSAIVIMFAYFLATRSLTPAVMYIVGFVELVLFFYFVSISYIPIGALIVGFLIILGLVVLRFRGGT